MHGPDDRTLTRGGRGVGGGRTGRIDWPEVKARVDLTSVATALIGPPARTSGNRSSWHCPFHDDRNPSFTVDPKGWRCWACGIGGDAAALVMRHQQIGFLDALQWLAHHVGIGARPSLAPRPNRPAPKPTPKPKPIASAPKLRGLCPGDAWSLVKDASERIWKPEGAAARSYLQKVRGLRPETIREARLGWTARVWLPTSDGLRVWPASGIVVPWIDGRQLCQVKIRQPDGRVPRYAQAFADDPLYFPNTQAIVPGIPLIGVEGELDALLLGQELAGLASVITTGSASSRLNFQDRHYQIIASTRWYAAHDADSAGDTAAALWPRRAIRVRPPVGKDWGDARQAGVDLRAWWSDRLAEDARREVKAGAGI